MSTNQGSQSLLALVLLVFLVPPCLADYKELLARGTDQDELRELYEKYEAEILNATGEVDPTLLKELSGSTDYIQSFMLACLSNGWSVRAEDVDRRYCPPCGTWAYTQENYGGTLRQFPYDCKTMDCMDVASLEGFPLKSLLVGSKVSAKLYTEDGFTGSARIIDSSRPSFESPPNSIRLRTNPRIDYVTISGYKSKNGRASFRLHVSGANIDKGSVLVVDQKQMKSDLEMRMDNSRWLGLGEDTARAGYNLDPTYYAFPILHYDSIAAEVSDVFFGHTLSIEVHNSFSELSNVLTYVVPSPDKLDSDGDGLLDEWELGSVDGLNLVELGANPYRKDVYVEVDRMIVPGRIWSDFSEQDYPTPATFDESVRSYAAAPIINPDLSTGISLHIDFGQEKFEQTEKSEGGTEIPWKRFLGYKRSEDFRRKHPEYYDAVELRNNPEFFSRERMRVFRYCIFGDQQWSSRSTGGGNFQSTFFVTLGVCRMNAINRNYQTGVFLHELGHMFGLSHYGSGKHYNYKPNFNSLMNYKFVFQGRDLDGKMGGGRGNYPGEQIYSYSEGMRATLDEGALNEVLGVANHYPHDWNKNGIIDSEPINMIISRHRNHDGPRVLEDCADWALMRFNRLKDARLVARDKPRRLTEQEIPGVARVPTSVDFGFMCEIDGAIQTGHWKVIGKVTKHNPGKITFATEEFRVRGKVRTKSMIGHLAYKLPEELQLALQVGDPITILHDYSEREKRLERNIHISSGTELILATAQFDDHLVPQSVDRVKVVCGSLPSGHIHFYWSDPADNDSNQELKTAPKIPAPIFLECVSESNLIPEQIAENGYQPLQLRGNDYLFRVLEGKAELKNKPASQSDQTPALTDSEAGVYQGGECLLLKVAAPKPPEEIPPAAPDNAKAGADSCSCDH